MKTTDLQAFGLIEMNEAEMHSVDGGNIFKSVANAICVAADAVADAAVDAYNWCKENVTTNANGNGCTIG